MASQATLDASPPRRQRSPSRIGALAGAAVRSPWFWGAVASISLATVIAALHAFTSWNVSEPFVRNAPDVDRAIQLYEDEAHEEAEALLEAYLETGTCDEGGLGTPERIRQRPAATFDLGLVLHALAKRIGNPAGAGAGLPPGPGASPGAIPGTPAAPADEAAAAERAKKIGCAQVVLKAIAADPEVAVDLRARAHYLSGNLDLLGQNYEEAVLAYNEALKLVPGFPEDRDDLDAIGRDAAYNRALAQRLQEIEEQKKEQEKKDQDDQNGDENQDQDDQEKQDENKGDQDQKRDPEEDQQKKDDGEEEDDDKSDEKKNDDKGEPQEKDQADDGDEEEPAPEPAEPQPDDKDEEKGDEEKAPKPESNRDEPDPTDDPPDEDAERPVDGDGQRERLLDELDEAPSYQEEQAKRRRRGRRRRTMEDK